MKQGNPFCLTVYKYVCVNTKCNVCIKNCIEQKNLTVVYQTRTYFKFSVVFKYSLKTFQCLQCFPSLVLSEMCNKKRSTRNKEMTC